MIQSSDRIPLLYDMVLIIFEGFAQHKYILREWGEEMTFQDCIDIAKANGAKENDVIIVILDSPLEGVGYMYNNYADNTWTEYCRTNGYA